VIQNVAAQPEMRSPCIARESNAGPPLEWVERTRLRWPLNLYKATRRRRSLDDCVHDVFRTVWIFACRRASKIFG
jgi:hypothetical protein